MAHPCGNCSKNCTRMCVFCEKCETWFHQKCQKLTKDQFRILSQTKSCDFICTQCCHTKDHKFDYDLSISRLEAYASKNLLTDGVNVEKILLRKEPLTQIIGETNHTYSAMSSLVEDRVSRQILNEQSMIIKERNPVQVSTNGNCLFNSLSVDMCGNESLATRLRVLTCIEMVSNKLIYDTSKHNRLELV
ncbi:unnamed protein product [Mytilus edulis]|uniref:PHD-type domain-containing protein n=1 Tax=Mytilus edulis TaxID=6550 RepID=A0A8S3TZI8_MYTED|nr:unnamed protein product [Mytilus edulis]